jgi:hypothetical protein
MKVTWCVKRFRSRRLHPQQCVLVSGKARLTGDSPMKKFIFAALTVTAVISATASGAFQQAPQAQLTEDGAAGWSIAESGAAPGWSITPAHARMW